MTNAELRLNMEMIETLRCCAASDCEHCPKHGEPICPSMTELFNAAADEIEKLNGIIDVFIKEDA